jgi:REP element-mobilizing transposase RayT
MRSRYKVNDPHHAHFVTATVVEWLPVFTTAVCCDIIVRALEHCRAHKGLRIHGWVILDNHLHAILNAPDLSAVLRDFKSYTARELLVQIKADGRDWLLNQLAYYRAAHKATAHQLWQEGSHPQALLDDAMFQQKLEYLHNNPLKRGMVVSPEHWRYSSAHEGLGGALPVLRCDDWWEGMKQSFKDKCVPKLELGNEARVGLDIGDEAK